MLVAYSQPSNIEILTGLDPHLWTPIYLSEISTQEYQGAEGKYWKVRAEVLRISERENIVPKPMSFVDSLRANLYVAALFNHSRIATVLVADISDAVTPLGITTTSQTVASEDKSRSGMATMIGVGVGVAAAAFFVKPPLRPSHVAGCGLTRMSRGELV